MTSAATASRSCIVSCVASVTYLIVVVGEIVYGTSDWLPYSLLIIPFLKLRGSCYNCPPILVNILKLMRKALEVTFFCNLSFALYVFFFAWIILTFLIPTSPPEL